MFYSVRTICTVLHYTVRTFLYYISTWTAAVVHYVTSCVPELLLVVVVVSVLCTMAGWTAGVVRTAF
jgi:hypothetical protein